MRKICTIIAFCLLSLQAQDIEGIYEKARKLELQGDIKGAMNLYKEVANKIVFQEDNITNQKKIVKVSKDAPEYIKEEIQEIDKIERSLDEYMNPYEDEETKNTIGQILTGVFGLEPYHTNYLLPVVYARADRQNRENVETQFQISFKKDIYLNLFGLEETFAFGYSQTSWWQTFKESKPFRETNYRPEIFVYGPIGLKNFPLKGYQFGFLHESNGRDKEYSRSWNRFYLTTYFQLGGLFVSPRAWYRIPESKKRYPGDEKGDDNPDIHKYLGYGDLTLTLPWKRHLFRVTLRNNLDFKKHNRGALDFEWTFPLAGHSFFGYINYFTGYGQSLDDYNKHDDRVGIGFALSR